MLPNRSTGYCVDDVARLVIVSIGLERVLGDPSYARIRTNALAFLPHAWDRDSARMHNFMDYGRRWLDRPHVGDHVGRAVWALGVAAADGPVGAEAGACLRLLARCAAAWTRPPARARWRSPSSG